MKLTPRHRQILEIAVRRSPTKSSRKLQVELSKSGVEVGSSTLKRYLKNMGLVSRFAVRKLLLKKRHRITSGVREEVCRHGKGVLEEGVVHR